MLERYPTQLIIKTLPKIDRGRTYLREAYKFIEREKIVWPHVKSEIILTHYLFNADNKIKESEAVLIVILLLDLQEDFRVAMKRYTLRFLLSYKGQRKELALEMDPNVIEHPIAMIRGPVSWKCNYQMASNRLDQVLMVNHPVLQALNYLWYELYDGFIVFDTAKCYNDNIPLHFDILSEMIHNCCMIARDILMNDWLPRVADLVDAMIDCWKHLVPMKSKDGGRAAILFRCIHSLMSRQVQGLIKRSVDHFFNTLTIYKEGNEVHKYDLNHPKLIHRPFMTLYVMAVGKFHDNFHDLPGKQKQFNLYKNDDEDDPAVWRNDSLPKLNKIVSLTNESAFVIRESGKLLVKPYIEELPELFVSYFKEILRVGYNIPRLEFYMSQDAEQFGQLHVIDENHVDMLLLYENVREIVAKNQLGPRIYLYPIYTYYSSLLSDKIKLMTERIFEQETIPKLPTFISFMEKVGSVIDESFFLPDYVALNLFMLDCRSLNKVIVTLLHEIKNFVTNYFKALNQKENRRICDEFEEMSMHAGERPKETAEVVALQNYLTECKEERIVKLKFEIKRAAERVIFLLYHAQLDAEEIYLNSRTFLWPHELEKVLELSGARLSVVRENLEIALKERRTKFENYLVNERRKMETFRLRETKEFLSLDELKEKCDISDNFMEILKKCSKEAEAINVDENLLQLEVTSFPTLQEMEMKMEPIEQLWKTAYKFDKCHEIWYYGPFEKLNGDEVHSDVESMSETMLKLIKQLANNPQSKRIADQVRMKIDKFKVYLPVLDAICQNLNERHWALISEEIGQTVNPELFPTLSAMIDIDILRIVDRLKEIANAAAREYELNVQLTNMQTEWTNIHFELMQYRDSDAFILAGLDDVQSLLDDHILKSQSMRGSPFIAALGRRATDWEEKLINMQDIMDIWLKVQSTWMYLEPIFNSEDIMRQMPVEGRNFKAIDHIWRQIMQNTNNDRRVLQATDYPRLLELLRNAFADLEKVQKGLNTYLEKKRIFFARFFFLSNDEILEILSETKDPKRVQPYLRKCFEGINSLEFDQNNEITALVSTEKEVLVLNKKINPTAANGLVEKWLKEVQTIMLESVLTQMKGAYDSYWTSKRSEWSMKWCGQIVQTVSRTTWTKETEDAINSSSLIKYETKYNECIADSIALICESLSPGALINLESLLVLDIQARDILNRLIDAAVGDVDNFNWISQLRYYWKYDDIDKTDIISVSMLWSDIRYGMEYLGNISRLIVTPQTDRCFRSVMEASRMGLSSMALGATGTGKTETLKDLTKAVGKKSIVFNCVPTLDYIVIGKFFKGLIQTGAWVIFYDFNCIQPAVLSVIAQQIMTIQSAKAQNAIKIVFQETALKLDASCGVFVTINPDYPVRHKLPDNLKSQFRSFAMLPLDSVYIFEMILFANAFKESKLLARKLVQLHQLCADQLSYAEHYDFGVRTTKSVVSLAKSLKRESDTLSETQAIFKAILEVNLAKLIPDDAIVFSEICAQIFPNANICDLNVSTPIEHFVRECLKKHGLESAANFVEKIQQIYRMLSISDGIIIVGESMSGKTTAWQILADTLRDIKSNADATITEYDVAHRIINPKSMSMNQLFGHIDPTTREWSEGVIEKVFREMVTATTAQTPSRGWIIFDGVIDPIWTESLHTLLDNNRKLCLASGEMIAKTSLMAILFETDDLQYASPATVARCAVVYIDQSKEQWKCLHSSFVHVLHQIGLIDIYMTLFETLVDWLIPATLEILIDCKSELKVSSTQHYKIFTTFFKHFVENQPQLNQVWFQQTLLFCLAWAYGSTLRNDERKKLDHRLRKVLHGSVDEHPKPKLFTLNRGQMFPEKMLMTDYRFDGIETWWPWLKSDDVSFGDNMHISKALVPTKETNTMLYWLDLAVKVSIPIVLVGDAAIGKSVTIRHFLNDLPKEKFINCVLNLAANARPDTIQEMVMAKLDRRRKGVFGPPVGKWGIVCADNLAIPSFDQYESQPSIELLRQWIDHKYWADLNDSSKLELVDLFLIGAMNPPGGRNHTFSRFYRHAFLLALDSVEMSSVNRIFTSLSEWHFSQGFSDKVTLLAKTLAFAICGFYEQVKKVLLPTPQKFYYMFSLRDILRLFECITMVPAKKLTSPEKLMRLWAHETYRIYFDRVSEVNDQKFLLETLTSCCKTHFKLDLSRAFGKRIPMGAYVTNDIMRSLVFGNFMEPDAEHKTYDEVDDWTKLEKIINYYLNEYNSSAKTPMNLTLFKYSIEHITRISRALQIPQGHLIAVGNGGSGRKTSIKLAACMAGAELFHFDFSASYTMKDWRDDMKKVLMEAGLNARSTFLIYPDTNNKYATNFMNDIITVMDNSELPNLFQSDDKTRIMDAMQLVAKKSDHAIDTTPAALYKLFVERIRSSLHIALVVPSIGDKFRDYIHCYPSLLNYCTIDHFLPWPADALQSIAEKFIGAMDLSHPKLSKKPSTDSDSGDKLPTVDPGTKPIQLSSFEMHLVNAMLLFNATVSAACQRLFGEFKRPTYVTPASFLEMLNLFKELYERKHSEITMKRERYTTGLEKLDSAAAQVGDMQQKLFDLQPKLKQLSDETEQIMITIERDTAQAEKKKEVVGADEAAANEAAAAAQAIKDDCDGDLQEAIPAFNAALAALNTLKPPDITIVKSMKNPPLAVKLVLEAVCVIRGIKPDRKSEPSGKITEDYWSASLKMLSDLKFLENLKTFDKDNIPVATMKRIREKYISDRDFNPDKVKNVSTACEGLCKWIRAMDIYDRVAKIVAPKQQALTVAELELADQMEKLNSKRTELQIILDKLQGLNDFFAEKSRQKKNLEDEIDNCEKKLDRAETLLSGMSVEKVRWSEIACALRVSLENVIGDVLLSSAFVAYLGSFPKPYRAHILADWFEKCLEYEIPCTEDFKLHSTLCDPSEIRSWTMSELPNDNYAVENAIIVKNVHRYPLLIDPQAQANTWLKNIEKGNGLRIIQYTDENYVDILADAISKGNSVLIENMHEAIDKPLYQVLERNIVTQKSGQMSMLCSNNLIEYNDNFRLYLTTCLPNPHFLPQIASKITLVDFTLTEQGLQQKILTTIIAEERLDLQDRKENHIVELVKNCDLLYKLESNILEVLSSSEGNILEDENAINILSTSKSMSQEIQAKQITAVSVGKEIDSEREEYLVAARHASILYRCIARLSSINYMYQYSLNWFVDMFMANIRETPKRHQTLSQRLKEINSNFTKRIYRKTAETLYKRDRLPFSFLICIEMLRSQSLIQDEELKFLLTSEYQKKPYRQPDTVLSFDWMSMESKQLLNHVSQLPSLSSLCDDIKNNAETWQTFYTSENPIETILPEPYAEANQLTKLVIFKCLRPDALHSAIERFVYTFDDAFNGYEQINLRTAFKCSTPTTPLIHFASPGIDATADILNLAYEINSGENCKTISLGQNQGVIAEKMLFEAATQGSWIIFENCHVATDWMMKLESLYTTMLKTTELSADFRFWFVLKPTTTFPLIMLRDAIKIVIERPLDLRANMIEQYTSEPLTTDKFFNNAFHAPLASMWYRFVFAFNTFHAVSLERMSFASIGWSQPYDFNESIRKLSLFQLRSFVKQCGSIPYENFFYLANDCNYGNEIVDIWDRRLLTNLLKQFCNETATTKDQYGFFESTTLCIPSEPNRENSIEYLKSLPTKMAPCELGLHNNVDYLRNANDGKTLLQTVYATQIEHFSLLTATDAQQTTNDTVKYICDDILKRLQSIGELKAPQPNKNPFARILKREVKRFNGLLELIRQSLNDLKRGINGSAIPNERFNETLLEIANNKIPSMWMKRSYLTTKPLSSYIDDLLKRVEFFQGWSRMGAPNAFWFSAFYFPQALITTIKQSYAKHSGIDFDDVDVTVDVTSFETSQSDEFDTYIKDVKSKNKHTIAIYGLFMECARWNRHSMCIDESNDAQLHDSMPVILLIPCRRTESKHTMYEIPVYRNESRQSIATKCGHLTNFVAYFAIKSEKPATHWMFRGSTLLCQLNA